MKIARNQALKGKANLRQQLSSAVHDHMIDCRLSQRLLLRQGTYFLQQEILESQRDIMSEHFPSFNKQAPLK